MPQHILLQNIFDFFRFFRVKFAQIDRNGRGRWNIRCKIRQVGWKSTHVPMGSVKIRYLLKRGIDGRQWRTNKTKTRTETKDKRCRRTKHVTFPSFPFHRRNLIRDIDRDNIHVTRVDHVTVLILLKVKAQVASFIYSIHPFLLTY